MARGGKAARHGAAGVAEGIIAKEAKTLLKDAEKVGVKDAGKAGRKAGHNPLAPKAREDYEFNMVENPGPLDPSKAETFAGGRYDEVVLEHDVVLYRAGDANGDELGQFFTHEPPQSVAQVRIDSAVKREWLDADGNYPAPNYQATSTINAVYEVRIPAGTKVYPGPVANMGGVHMGGGHQIFIPTPWKTPGVEVLGKPTMLP